MLAQRSSRNSRPKNRWWSDSDESITNQRPATLGANSVIHSPPGTVEATEDRRTAELAQSRADVQDASAASSDRVQETAVDLNSIPSMPDAVSAHEATAQTPQSPGEIEHLDSQLRSRASSVEDDQAPLAEDVSTVEEPAAAIAPAASLSASLPEMTDPPEIDLSASAGPIRDDVQTGVGIGGGIVSTAKSVGRAGQKIGRKSGPRAVTGATADHDRSGNEPDFGDSDVVSGFGAGAGFLSAVGNTLDAYNTAQDWNESTYKKEDKAGFGMRIASDLGAGVESSAEATTRSLDIAGASASAAGSVIAPAGIVTGGLNLGRGVYEDVLNSGRQDALNEIENSEESDEGTKGLAQAAKKTRVTRKWGGRGRTFKGALQAAGGAVLLAAGLSNPVGWGLMAGAAVTGAGMGLHKVYRQAKMGRQAAKSQGDAKAHKLHERLSQIEGLKEHLDREKLLDADTSRVGRVQRKIGLGNYRYGKLLRGKIAEELAKDLDKHEDIISEVGLRAKDLKTVENPAKLISKALKH